MKSVDLIPVFCLLHFHRFMLFMQQKRSMTRTMLCRPVPFSGGGRHTMKHKQRMDGDTLTLTRNLKHLTPKPKATNMRSSITQQIATPTLTVMQSAEESRFGTWADSGATLSDKYRWNLCTPWVLFVSTRCSGRPVKLLNLNWPLPKLRHDVTYSFFFHCHSDVRKIAMFAGVSKICLL